MKLIYLLIIIFVFFSFLGAEEVDSVQATSTDEAGEPVIESIEEVEEGEDVFLDTDGDGIADNRTFRERMQNWRRTRSMSEKIRNSGQDNSPDNGKFGKKAKEGGQGNGNGNGNGNRSG